MTHYMVIVLERSTARCYTNEIRRGIEAANPAAEWWLMDDCEVYVQPRDPWSVEDELEPTTTTFVDASKRS